MTKFQPENIYIHLHQMLPFLFIEEKFEYFRKMRDYTKREAKQPEKLSLGYSPDVPAGLKPLRVLMYRLNTNSMDDNQADEAEPNEHFEDIKFEPNRVRGPIHEDSDQSTVRISSSGSDGDEVDGQSDITMIEVAENEQEEASIDNEVQLQSPERPHSQNNATALLFTAKNNEPTQPSIVNKPSEEPARNTASLSMAKNNEPAQPSKVNKPSKEPARKTTTPSLPCTSMPIIDETDESEMHEDNAIASQFYSTAFNESFLNSSALDTDSINVDDDWHQIQRILTNRMMKDHRIEQQRFQEGLNTAKERNKKLESENQDLKKENEHWKKVARQTLAEIREKTADFNNQLEEEKKAFKQIVKRLELEHADKIEIIRKEIEVQVRNKKWCAVCGKEIGAQFLHSTYCSYPCMHQSW